MVSPKTSYYSRDYWTKHQCQARCPSRSEVLIEDCNEISVKTSHRLYQEIQTRTRTTQGQAGQEQDNPGWEQAGMIVGADRRVLVRNVGRSEVRIQARLGTDRN